MTSVFSDSSLQVALIALFCEMLYRSVNNMLACVLHYHAPVKMYSDGQTQVNVKTFLMGPVWSIHFSCVLDNSS
jgi:hypothetical protein